MNKYLKLLEALKTLYKDNIIDKFRNVEKHMIECDNTMINAEEKAQQCLLQMGLLASAAAGDKARSPRVQTAQRQRSLQAE